MIISQFSIDCNKRNMISKTSIIKLNLIMENSGWLDVLIGSVAIVILLGGLILLFKGISSMQK